MSIAKLCNSFRWIKNTYCRPSLVSLILGKFANFSREFSQYGTNCTTVIYCKRQRVTEGLARERDSHEEVEQAQPRDWGGTYRWRKLLGLVGNSPSSCQPRSGFQLVKFMVQFVWWFIRTRFYMNPRVDLILVEQWGTFFNCGGQSYILWDFSLFSELDLPGPGMTEHVDYCFITWEEVWNGMKNIIWIKKHSVLTVQHKSTNCLYW